MPNIPAAKSVPSPNLGVAERPNPIRILVVDDHPVTSKGIVSCLADDAHLQVVGEAADGNEALAKAKALVPNVVLMDIEMPKLDGLAAAARLHLAQPSLSRQIRNLEEELGVTLLKRTKGGITITAAGQEYLTQARKLLADSASAIRMTQAVARSERRQLVIGSVEPPLASGLLARILKAFTATHPDVRIETREYVSLEQHRYIAARELDAGFVYRPPEDDSLFDSVTVLENRHVAALPSEHPLLQKRELFLRDLAGEPFIQFPRWLWPERVDAIAQKCTEAGFTMRVVLEAQPMHNLLNLVGRGFGVAIIPDPICWPSGCVEFRRIQDFDLSAAFHLTWLRSNHSKLLRGFIEIVRQVAANAKSDYQSNQATHPARRARVPTSQRLVYS